MPASYLDKHTQQVVADYLFNDPHDVLLVQNSLPQIFLSELDWNRNCGYNLNGPRTSCSSINCVLIHYIATNAGFHYLNGIKRSIGTLQSHADKLANYVNITEWRALVDARINPVPCHPTTNTEFKKCNHCGQRNLSKKLYNLLVDTYGVAVCNNCTVTEFTRCYDCSTVIGSNKYHYAPNVQWMQAPNGMGQRYCEACFYKYYAKCPQCARWDKVGNVYGDGCRSCESSVINEYTYHPQPIFYGINGVENHRPSVAYLGVELEVEMKDEFIQLTNTIAKRFARDVKDIAYLKKDSSIAAGFEIVSHPASIDWWQKKDNVLLKSISKLSKTCESFWAESTGLHVHISVSPFTTFHKALFVKFISDNKMFTSFVAERYQSNQAPFDYRIDRSLEKIIKQGSQADRHTAINLNSSQKTIEIRVFKGNMKRARILKDVEYVHSVYTYTKELASKTYPAKDNNWTTETIDSLKDSMNVGAYKGWLEERKDIYPNIWEFTKNYKRSN